MDRDPADPFKVTVRTGIDRETGAIGMAVETPWDLASQTATRIMQTQERATREALIALGWTPPASDPAPTDPVLIWSDEHGSYWRPNGNGYTVRAGAAGVWERAKADSIVASVPDKRLSTETLPRCLGGPMALQFDDERLLRSAIRGLCVAPANARSRRQPLWSAVMSMFALGSTKAQELCRRFDFDPDRKVKA